VPFIVGGGATAGARLPRGAVVTNLTSLLDVYPTLLSMARLAQPAPGMLTGSSLSPFLGLPDAPTIAARKPYVVSQYHSNMGNTGAFCVVQGNYKYIAFGHGFNATFGAYAPQLFDVHADPEELNDLARARPSVAASLDRLLRSELASGFNALSTTGDYSEIDVYVKGQQQALYQKFFRDEGRVQRQYDRLVECEAARASLSVAEFVHADPELELPCAASLGEPVSVEDPTTELLGVTKPVKQLRKLFEKAYTGFDDADWAKVQAWAKADPGR